jgi:hypothetical protein
LTVDSDKKKGTGKDPEKDKMEKSKDNEKSSSNNNDIPELFSSLKKFVVADDLNIDKTNDELGNKTTEKPTKSRISRSKADKNDDQEGKDKSEDHPFNFSEIIGHDSVNSLKTRKDSIIKGSALIIGGILILYGLVLITASITRVADNVIFGEKAMLSTFLILLGVLIIVAAFAQRILNRTFLNKIHTELEVAEGKPNGKSTVSDDTSKKVQDENHNIIGKDKKDKDNKDNIVGENNDNQGG